MQSESNARDGKIQNQEKNEKAENINDFPVGF